MSNTLALIRRWVYQTFRAVWQERRCAACLDPFIPEERLAGMSAFDTAGATVQAGSFCPSCRPAFRFREAGYCPYCGEPSALAEAPVMPCGECLQSLPPWDDFLFCGIYEGPLREMLLRAKFSGSLSAQAVLGELLAARCAEHYASAPRPDFIIPMPLHPQRLRERGYNQCVELARPLAGMLGIPLRHDILCRVHASPPQSRLTREQRKKLIQPFAVAGDVCGARILLLDDICTTGATLSRATEILRAAGASQVDAVVLARTSRHTPAGAAEGSVSALP